MRHILCLLLLSAVSGCHATHTETPDTKTRKRPDVGAPKLEHKSFTGDLPKLDLEAFADPPPSLRMTLRDKEDLPKMRYTCIATGEFNLAPELDHLMMETWCVGDDGKGSKVAVHVDDEKAPRANSHFNVPFARKAKVTIKEGKKPTLELHYVDGNGKSRKLLLKPRELTRYQFSFADLVPDDIEPEGEYRVM